MKNRRRKILYIWMILWIAWFGFPGAGSILCPELRAAETGTEPASATASAETPEITLSAAELRLQLGTTSEIQVEGLPAGLEVKNWNSSKPERVTVSGQGTKALLKGIKPGKSTVSAVLSNGKKLLCRVTVPKVKLSKTKITLAKGQELEISLKGTSVVGKWKSSKKKIAKPVVQEGRVVIQALRYGDAVITVTCESVSLTCEVSVKDPRLTKESLYLLEGDSYKLKVKKYSGDIRWSSVNPDVADVSSSGRVKAAAEGSTVIQAAVNGVTLSCPVTVASFRADVSELRVKKGDLVEIPVSGSASGGSWSCEDPKTASFDEQGRLLALRSGMAKLSYKVGDSVYRLDLLIYGKKSDEVFASRVGSRKVQFSSLRNMALSSQSRYRFMQGCATDGTYGYFVLCDQNYQNACALIKIRLSDWKVMKVGTGLKIYHGNDLTYNSKKKKLVVVHCEGDFTGISMISPKTLKVTETIHLDEEVNSIAYNSSKDAYVMGVAGTDRFVIKDPSFRTIGEFQALEKGSYTRQGLDAEKYYIYILQSRMDEGLNRVMVYTWNGLFVTEILLEGNREAESLFHIGKKFVIAYNDSGFNGGNVMETSLKPYYQLRYTSGGAGGSMKWQMVSLSENVKISSNIFQRDGYRFLGWKLTRSSDGKVCCRKENGKAAWLNPETTEENYEIFLVQDQQKIAPMTSLAGDSITLQAQWEKLETEVSQKDKSLSEGTDGEAG